MEGDLDDEQRWKPIEERLRSSEPRRPKTRVRSSSGRSAVRSFPQAASAMEARSYGGVAPPPAEGAGACSGSTKEAQDEGE